MGRRLFLLVSVGLILSAIVGLWCILPTQDPMDELAQLADPLVPLSSESGWGVPYPESAEPPTSPDDVFSMEMKRYDQYIGAAASREEMIRLEPVFFARPRPQSEIEILIGSAAAELGKRTPDLEVLANVFKAAKAVHEERMYLLARRTVEMDVRFSNAFHCAMGAIGFIGLEVCRDYLLTATTEEYWHSLGRDNLEQIQRSIQEAVVSIRYLPPKFAISALESVYGRLQNGLLVEPEWKPFTIAVLDGMDVAWRRARGETPALPPYWWRFESFLDWPEATWRYGPGGRVYSREPLQRRVEGYYTF